MKLRIQIITLATILLMSMMNINITMAGVPSESHNADAMWVEPSSITFTPANATVGQKFNVTVWLNITSANVFSHSIGLRYNRTQLKGVRGGFTSPPGSEFMKPNATTPAGPIIDTSYLGNGTVLATETFSGEDFRGVPRVGSLIWVEFQIIAIPPEGQVYTSKFDITRDYPSDTWVMDTNLNLISIATHDAEYKFIGGAAPVTYTLTITATTGGTTNPLPSTYTYPSGTPVSVTATPDVDYSFDHWELDGTNIGSAVPVTVTMDEDHTLHAVFIYSPAVGARIYVDPPEIIDPTMLPSSTFAINITIDDVADLKICEFNLTYITTILSCYGITIRRVQGQFPSAKMTADDEAGFVWVRLNYSTPVTTSIPTPIATIEFHVEALGASPLDLHDTKLLDPEGNPIAHQASDGYFATLIRDIAITNVVPDKNWVYEGQIVKINVTAKNEGNNNETFKVSAKYNGTLIGNITVKDLPPGNETTITFAWNTTTVTPCHNYTISAEAEILPYELDTSDNTYTDGAVKVRFVGDVNNDGRVDGLDITIVCAAFASYGPDFWYPGSPPHPRWNPDADINFDNRIDGVDVMIVCRNFGKACPP